MTVDQLEQFVRSSIALKYDDKKIADFLKKVTLTQKLDDKTIEDLASQGAGVKTVKALDALRDSSSKMKPVAKPAEQVEETPAPTAATGPKRDLPPPDSVRQKEIMDEIRNYAASYTEGLPNFLCVQVTRRYIGRNGQAANGLLDTITARLSYHDGHEDYKIYLVNDTARETTFDRIGGGAVSTGEFGSLMKEIFARSSEATFEWDHWGKLRGKKLAVFNYFIDSGHSHWTVEYDHDQRIITAYKGLVYADEYTGVISRLTFQAVDIPQTFPVQEATTTLDYDEADIGGSPYMVPLKAVIRLRAGSTRTRNDVEFRLYHRFGGESTITYKPITPDALPSEQTTEQPASKDGLPPPPPQ